MQSSRITGGSPSRPKLQHVKMRFFFTRMDRAHKFREAIHALNIPAQWNYNRNWYVETDTRILEHAAELRAHLYGGAR